MLMKKYHIELKDSFAVVVVIVAELNFEMIVPIDFVEFAVVVNLVLLMMMMMMIVAVGYM